MCVLFPLFSCRGARGHLHGLQIHVLRQWGNNAGCWHLPFNHELLQLQATGKGREGEASSRVKADNEQSTVNTTEEEEEKSLEEEVPAQKEIEKPACTFETET